MTFQILGNITNVPNYVLLQQEQILIELMPIANCHENMNIQDKFQILKASSREKEKILMFHFHLQQYSNVNKQSKHLYIWTKAWTDWHALNCHFHCGISIIRSPSTSAFLAKVSSTVSRLYEPDCGKARWPNASCKNFRGKIAAA